MTSPFIKNPKKKMNNANVDIIPTIFILFEYNWYKNPKKIIQVNIKAPIGLTIKSEILSTQVPFSTSLDETFVCMLLVEGINLSPRSPFNYT